MVSSDAPESDAPLLSRNAAVTTTLIEIADPRT